MRIVSNRPLRALAWLCAAVSGVVISIYLVLLGINFRDQPPSEAALRLEAISRARTPVADDDNAYIYLLGFAAPRTEDPRALGKARAAWARELVKQAHIAPGIRFPGADHDFGATRTSFTKTLSDACSTVDRACLGKLEESDQRIAQWVQAERWVLDRYETLLAHPAWLETVPFDVRLPLPAYAGVLDGQKLLLGQAWLAAGHADAAAVRSLLEKDVRFWRQTLAASDLLISKMIAVAALKRHFTWGNIILRRLPSRMVTDGVPPLWLAPISDLERSMLRSLAGEWAFADRTVRLTRDGHLSVFGAEGEGSAMKELLWRALRPALQVQDTSNGFAKRILSVAETLHVPYADTPQAVERARALTSAHAESAFPARAYNIVGDVLLAVGTWDFTTDAVRVADIEGLRRMAVMATDFRMRGVSREDVAPALSDSGLRNPYTGQPFLWDEGAGAMVFTGLEPGARGRHAILY